MRLLRSIILSTAMVILGSVSVFAAGTQEFAVDEIGIKFQVPKELLGYTRTSDISQDVMNALGYSTEEYKDHLVSKMEEEDNYYIGFDANVSYQVSLKSVESSIDTYSTMTDEEILQLIDGGLEEELTEYGVEVAESSVFTEGDRKYAVVGLSDTTGHCYLYATVYDSQAYYFYIRSYQGEINDAHKTLIKQIAGSVEFYEKSDVVQSAGSSTSSGGTQAAGSDVDFIDVIIQIARVVAVIVIAVIALIAIMSSFSKRKARGRSKSRGRGRRKGSNSYSLRPDFAYQERLRRVMEVDKANDKPKVQEAQLEAADDGVSLDDVNA